MKLVAESKKNKKENKLFEQQVLTVYKIAFEFLLKNADTKKWFEHIAEESGLFNKDYFKKPNKKEIVFYVALLYLHILITSDEFDLDFVSHLKCTKEELSHVILKVSTAIIEEMEPLQEISVDFNDFIELD
ncbi:hypothetical protein ACWGJQ_27910 [Peribacillus simplex]